MCGQSTRCACASTSGRMNKARDKTKKKPMESQVLQDDIFVLLMSKYCIVFLGLYCTIFLAWANIFMSTIRVTVWLVACLFDKLSWVESCCWQMRAFFLFHWQKNFINCFLHLIIFYFQHPSWLSLCSNWTNLGLQANCSGIEKANYLHKKWGEVFIWCCRHGVKWCPKIFAKEKESTQRKYSPF